MADYEAGRVLGDRFEVVGVLGHGGMATVYLAQDRLRGESVALKVLHGHLANSASWRSRLRREVSAASRLRHPSALVASDLHELDGTLAVSMPLHPGQTLGEHVERHGPLTGQALERIARQLASALREAHGAGLVHRDVTPSNVMVDDHGDAVLTDFGLARFTDQRSATATGVLGTAGYAAPEVYKGVRGDPRSDLYGLGAVLYQAATGTAPFAAPDPMGVLQKQLTDDRVPLAKARPDLPAHLSALVDRLLAIDPEARPQGAADVLDALDKPSRPAVTRAPAAKSSDVPVRKTHLPPGEWTVVVAERRRDRRRRNALRSWMERRRQADVAADMERAIGEVKRRVMGLIQMEPVATPEDRLGNAVAREASLPPGSLAMPYGMVERRFRLVEAVGEPAAQRLARIAREEGFEATAVRLGPPAKKETDVGWPLAQAWPALGVLFLAMVATFAFTLPQVGTQVRDLLTTFGGAIPFVFLFVFVVPGVRRRQRAERLARYPAEELPLAFGSDLRFHLAPNSPVVLDPPSASTPEPLVVGPAPVVTSASRHAAVIERSQAQLTAFEQALASASDRLPEAAIRDLRGTLRDLGERVAALGKRVMALEAELLRLDDAAAAAAIDRIEARLARLRTLARAGRSEEAAEIPKLEQALGAHRTVLEQAEALEGQLTLAVARLLETGATAAHARIELIDAPEPGRSADDLLGRLRQQTDDARRALGELEPAPTPRLARDPLPESPKGDRQKVPDRA